MEIWLSLYLPLAALLAFTLAAAFLVERRTSDINKAAIIGGSVIPIFFLADTIYWLGWDMAVDDPPPGMILIALPVTFFGFWMIFYSFSYCALRLTAWLK